MDEKMDLRIKKTYLLLHNAFTELLEEKRFEDFTVNELCDRAMIRRATFYKHFADKYEYFTFYMKEMVETFQDRLAPDVGQGEANTYLAHMSRELVRFMKQHERLVQNIRNSNVFPVLLSILLEQISADALTVMQRSEGHTMDRWQLEGVAAFYAGGLANALFQAMKRGTPMDEDAFAQLISMFLLQK